jgi:hypothetical protein
MSTQASQRPITDILEMLGRQVQRLIATEYELARAEISENVSKARGGITLLSVGMLLLIPGVTLLLAGLALALTRMGLSLDLATLLVSAVVLLLGLIVANVGLSRLKSAHFVPDKALNQLQRDMTAINPMRNTHEHSTA